MAVCEGRERRTGEVVRQSAGAGAASISTPRCNKDVGIFPVIEGLQQKMQKYSF